MIMPCKNNQQECFERLRQRMERSNYKYDAVFRAVPIGTITNGQKPSLLMIENQNIDQLLLDDDDYSEILPIPPEPNHINKPNNNADLNLSIKGDIPKKNTASTPFPAGLIQNKPTISDSFCSIPSLKTPNRTIEISSEAPSNNDTSPLISTTKKRRRLIIDDDDDDDYVAEANPPPAKISPKRNDGELNNNNSSTSFCKARLFPDQSANVAVKRSPPTRTPINQTELLKQNYSIMMKICDFVEQYENDGHLTLPINLKTLLKQRRTLLAQIRGDPVVFQDVENDDNDENSHFISTNGDASVYLDAASRSVDLDSIRSPPCKRQDQKPTPLKLRVLNENNNSDIVDSKEKITNDDGPGAKTARQTLQSQFKEIDSPPPFQYNYFSEMKNENRPFNSNEKEKEWNEYIDVVDSDVEVSNAIPTNGTTTFQTDIADLSDLSEWDYENDDLKSTSEKANFKQKQTDTISVINLDSQSSTVPSDQILNAALRAESDYVQVDLNKSVLHNYQESENDGLNSSVSYHPRFFGLYQNDANETILKSKDLPHSEKMFKIFYEVFGLTSFRTNQLEAINAALLNHDVFILMPTGGGKSLCYQLPAFVTPGVTVIVSPLRSLMQDQVTKLNKTKEGCAAALTGDLDAATNNSIYKDLRSKNPTIKLLYVTPEKLSASGQLGSLLSDLYEQNRLARFVIDEAHCVSQWGHDFRKDYKRLSVLRQSYGKVPFMALTATATQKVRIDIAQQLGLREAKWFMQSFNRANLKFEVRPKTKNTFEEIAGLLLTEFRNNTGIIYCLSRNDCDQLAEKLQANGFKAVSYHAGLSDEVRRTTQENWIKGKFNIVVATIAFGMGIDKHDCRFVIHHSMPKSVEGYYQEVGRAGRDGKLAHCILYYTPNDFNRWKKVLSKSTGNNQMQKVAMSYLYDVQMFCTNKAECRRKQILKYFGENYDDRLCFSRIESVCDNCLVKDNFSTKDFTTIVKTILESIRNLVGAYNQEKKEKISTRQLISIVCGGSDPFIKDRHQCSPMYGILTDFTRTDNTRLIQNLVAKKYLAEDTVVNKNCAFASISYIRLGERASDILLRGEKFEFSVSKKSTNNASLTTGGRNKRKPAAKNVTSAGNAAKRPTLDEAMNVHTSKANNYLSNSAPAIQSNLGSNCENSLVDFIVPDDVFDDDDFDDYQKNIELLKTTKRTAKRAPAKPRAKKPSTTAAKPRARKTNGTASAKTNSKAVNRKTSSYFKNGQTSRAVGGKKQSTAPSPIILEDDDGFFNIPD